MDSVGDTYLPDVDDPTVDALAGEPVLDKYGAHHGVILTVKVSAVTTDGVLVDIAWLSNPGGPGRQLLTDQQPSMISQLTTGVYDCPACGAPVTPEARRRYGRGSQCLPRCQFN